MDSVCLCLYLKDAGRWSLTFFPSKIHIQNTGRTKVGEKLVLGYHPPDPEAFPGDAGPCTEQCNLVIRIKDVDTLRFDPVITQMELVRA